MVRRGAVRGRLGEAAEELGLAGRVAGEGVEEAAERGAGVGGGVAEELLAGAAVAHEEEGAGGRAVRQRRVVLVGGDGADEMADLRRRVVGRVAGARRGKAMQAL